jgi:hypothetical protein
MSSKNEHTHAHGGGGGEGGRSEKFSLKMQ